MRKIKGTLTKSIMSISILPLLVLGILVAIICTQAIYASLRDEIGHSLEVQARNVYEHLSLLYPGALHAKGGQLYKGEVPLSEELHLVDRVKEISGSDITFFCGDVRCLTTVRNTEGMHATGTRADERVTEKVLKRGESYFSDRVNVDGTFYFGYYLPLFDQDSQVIGMLFVGRVRAEVIKQISGSVLTVWLTLAGVLAVALALSYRYGRKLILALSQVKEILEEGAAGDLEIQPDPKLLARQDEIGDMGRFAVALRMNIANLLSHDPLTGLRNRRYSEETLQRLAQEAEGGGIFTVAMGDIDCFKAINDTYGHQAGDEVLRQVAAYIGRSVQSRGLAFRWGGEEFLLVYTDIGSAEASEYLQDLRVGISQLSIPWKGEKLSVTMTFGTADSSQEKNVDKLVQLADASLYIGKASGRNCVVDASQ